MELRQLRYFVAVATDENISRAAQKMFLSQPALSRQIKALEEEVGQCLFERQAHSLRTTPAGKALLKEALELLERSEQMLKRVRSAGQEQRLRVGYAPSLASGLLANAVERFAKRNAETRVELFDLSTREILAGLENETLDVALTVCSERQARAFRWKPLLEAPWKLAVNRQHRLSKQTQVSSADIAGERLLVFSQRDYPEYWKLITDWLRRHRQPPTISGEYDGVTSLMSAVESGLGVALVTTSSTQLAPKRVRLKTVSSPPKPVRIAAGHRPERSKEVAIANFLEELRKAAPAFA